jgi:hypothetical protein
MMNKFDETKRLARCLIKNKPAREGLTKIDEDLPSYYNSINVFCGRQGQGKTYSAVVEIANITKANDKTCLVIYVTKEGMPCDDTFEHLKELILCPILYVSEKDAERLVKKTVVAMDVYKGIKDSEEEEYIDPEVREYLFSSLAIDDFSRDFLHVIILFDDFANSPLSKEKGWFASFFATLRHKGFSVFICIQYWRSIPTQLKSNITMLYLFGGYSKQQLRPILDQVRMREDSRDIDSKYSTMKDGDKMIVDTIKGTVFIEKKVDDYEDFIEYEEEEFLD